MKIYSPTTEIYSGALQNGNTQQSSQAFQESYHNIVRYLWRVRILSSGLIVVSGMLTLALFLYIGFYQKPDHSSDIPHTGNALGSKLSHLTSLSDGWQFHLEVERITFDYDGESELSDTTHLENVKIEAIRAEDKQKISFSAPFALWEQQENQFLLHGGCRIWLDDLMDISTEEVHVNLTTKEVVMERELNGRYARNWVFTAQSAKWSVTEERLIFGGRVEFGQRFEEI